MNTTLDFSYIPNLIIDSAMIAMLVSLFISYLTLPFYFYVHNLKKHKEKNLPIVKFFYKAVKLSYFVFIVLAIVLFFCISRESNSTKAHLGIQNDENLMKIVAVFTLFLIYILHILQQTFHLLLFSLAIMSYLKYQFPYDFLYSQNYISKYVRNFNVFFVLKDFVCSAILVLHFEKLLGNELMNITSGFYLVLYIAVNMFICLLTPFINISIITGMKKNRHLHSQQHIYIQKYMFIQSIMVLFFKIITVTISIPIFFDEGSVLFVSSMSIVDFMAMPLVIQLSYLRCNLNELYNLFTSFNCCKFLKIVFGRVDATVHPILPHVAFSIT
ncbi:Serpentine Receptor, class Z [Caenorhabditis elegans]|uniref:Serpentine Receptor, class Z n=1 Tax=Caenorhabditis elegans TaxID=6239 RepID=Q9XV00_CAEEL|nr:Serpentine Receptor, class Z [Caenorhabditis elegans]CAB04444.1 Serpentine Receptor, class Z [Caenorhabditis elegans]|eukprot:NP_507314.1 Serpentine Receptor, class Z [Caenorhabditis elegans]